MQQKGTKGDDMIKHIIEWFKLVIDNGRGVSKLKDLKPKHPDGTGGKTERFNTMFCRVWEKNKHEGNITL